MKKILLLTAICAAAFVGCTNNDEDPQQVEMNFSPLSYKSTRAIINSQIYDLGSPSFGIFAYYTGSNSWKTNGASSQLYINNATVEADNTNKIWKSNPKSYWPIDGGKLTFIAYSPKQVGVNASYNTNVDNKGVLTITDFTVGVELNQLSPDQQVDLMFSKSKDAFDKTSNDGNYQYATGTNSSQSGVSIVFNHALTQLIVNAKLKEAYPGATFAITKLDLINLKNKGTFTLTTTYNASNETMDYPIWGSQTGDYTQHIFDNEASPKALDSDPANTVAFPAVLVLPQDLVISDPANTGTDQLLEVTYKMTTSGTNVSTYATKQVYLKQGTFSSFAMNKKITLTLSIGADEIQYAPSVVDWSTGSESYDIPN